MRVLTGAARGHRVPPRPEPARPDLPRPPRPDLPRTPSSPPRRWGLRAAAALVALSLVVTGVGAFLFAGPLEHGTAHTFLARRADGEPFRWDPCRPIVYETNLLEAPDGALDDVHEAVRRVAEATGIRFLDGGTTMRTAGQQIDYEFRSSHYEGGFLPVLIAWEDAKAYARFADPKTSVAVGLAEPGVGSQDWVYRSGLIVVNAEAWVPSGFVHRDALGPTLMHEWGHVLGLGHVGDGRQLMWSSEVRGADPVPEYWQSDWGEGDLVGLGSLGRRAGCIGELV